MGARVFSFGKKDFGQTSAVSATSAFNAHTDPRPVVQAALGVERQPLVGCIDR